MNKIKRTWKNVKTSEWRWRALLYLLTWFELTIFIGWSVLGNDSTAWPLKVVFAVFALWVLVRFFEPRGKPVKAKVMPKTLQLNLDAPNPKAIPTITVEQMLLFEKATDRKSQYQYTNVIDLWSSLYGQPCDYSRPLSEVIEEIQVALSEKML